MSTYKSTNREGGITPHSELDIIVLHIELTLISITQGVALTFLIDRSYQVLVDLRWPFWPYALTGLLTILIFWSRALIHTLTVIRWPLEMIHNFMYIACSFLEAVTFTQLTNPLRWYLLNALFSLMVWVLFILDLRMIHNRIEERTGPMGSKLLAIVNREQLLSIRFYVPMIFIFNLAAAAWVWFWKEPLLLRSGHMAVAFLQFTGALGYLIYSAFFFSKVVPLIGETRREWRGQWEKSNL